MQHAAQPVLTGAVVQAREDVVQLRAGRKGCAASGGGDHAIPRKSTAMPGVWRRPGLVTGGNCALPLPRWTGCADGDAPSDL